MNITIIAFLYINLGGVVQGERPTEKCDFGDKVLKQIWDSSIFHRKWFLIWIEMGVPSLNTSSCSPPTLVSLAGTEKDIIFLQFHETSSRSLSCGVLLREPHTAASAGGRHGPRMKHRCGHRPTSLEKRFLETAVFPRT